MSINGIGEATPFRRITRHVRVPAGLVGDSQTLAVSRDGSRIFFAQALEGANSRMTYVMTARDSCLRP